MWDDFVWALLVIFCLCPSFIPFEIVSEKSRKFQPFSDGMTMGHQPQRRACVSRPSKPPICCSSLRQLIFFSWGKLINFDVRVSQNQIWYDFVIFDDLFDGTIMILTRGLGDVSWGNLMGRRPGPTGAGHGHGCRIWMWILTWRMAWPWICGLNAEWDMSGIWVERGCQTAIWCFPESVFREFVSHFSRCDDDPAD